MKKFTNLLLLLLLSPVCSLFTQVTQVLTYDAYKGSQSIGTMVIKKSVDEKGTTYTSRSDISVKFLFTLDLEFDFFTRFEGPLLSKSTYKYVREGEVKETCVGKACSPNYETYVEEDVKKVDLGLIKQTVVTVYFQEPGSSKTEVFSERWGELLPLVSLGNHHYEMTLPNGNKNFMTYENGVCVEMELKRSYGNSVFKLRQ